MGISFNHGKNASRAFGVVNGGLDRAEELELRTANQRQALLVMVQLYSCMQSVDLAKDYTLDVDDGHIAMTVKNFAHSVESHSWMGMHQQGRLWHFYYNKFKAQDRDVFLLGEKARAGISGIEKRELPRLIVPSGRIRPAIGLVPS